MNARQKVFVLLGGDLVLLLLQLLYWHHPWMGWFLFCIYLWTTGVLWRSFLSRVYRIAPKSIEGRVLGPFASWVTVTMLGAVAVVWYILPPLGTWFVYAIGACIAVVVSYVHKGRSGKKDRYALTLNIRWRPFAIHSGLFLGFVITVLSFFLLVISGESTEVLFSPWQSLSHLLLPLFATIVVLLGIIIFSRAKTAGVLLLLVAASVLIHLYLPASHTQPWGGDVWRHIATTEQLVEGKAVLPVLFGPDVLWRDAFGLSLPEALLIPNKYVNGQFWTSAVIVAQTTGIDLASFYMWYMPLLWGVVFPVLLFSLGKLLFGSKQLGLVLAYAGFLPFTFQALGSFTLANSLGLLFFLFFLLLWLSYIKTGKRNQRIIPVVGAVLMPFGYTLYAMFLWGVMFASLALRFAHKKKKRIMSLVTKTSVAVISFFSLSLVEVYSHSSTFPVMVDPASFVKRFVGEMSGWYMARAIRPHDIVSGNIFYNHIPSYAFVDSVFTAWRWHVVFVVCTMLLLAFYGWCKFLASKSVVQQTVAVLTLACIGGYIVGWYLLAGDRLFVRRLDPMMAVVVLIAAVYGLSLCVQFVQDKTAWTKGGARLVTGVLLLLFAWSATTVYALGPDMRVVSDAEVAAAQHLVFVTQTDCVLADTWMLLPVEAFSQGTIVGGGFPIDYQFGQPERTLLFYEMTINPRESVIAKATKISGHDHCSFAVQADVISEEQAALITDIYKALPRQIGNILVWE